MQVAKSVTCSAPSGHRQLSRAPVVVQNPVGPRRQYACSKGGEPMGARAARQEHASWVTAATAPAAGGQTASGSAGGGMTSEVVLWGSTYVDDGIPQLSNFQLSQASVPEVKEGEVLLELLYLSIDSFTRGRMRTKPLIAIASFGLNQPCAGMALATVKKSRDASIPEGALVSGFMSWQQQQVVPAKGLSVLDVSILKDKQLPASAYLGALGMQGMTAYGSLVRIGKPKEGDTVYVSGASGSIGLTVGQLCKNVYGCARVVGSAGSDDKVEMLRQYGYDAAFNYKTTDIFKALSQECPKGVDLFVDNVGGATLQAVLETMNIRGRIVALGALSQYNEAPGARYGVTNLFNIVTRRLTMQGFLALDNFDLRPQFLKDMSQYVREGKVKHVEYMVQGGLPAAPQAFIDLMNGKNTGKFVVQCSPDPYRTK